MEPSPWRSSGCLSSYVKFNKRRFFSIIILYPIFFCDKGILSTRAIIIFAVVILLASVTAGAVIDSFSPEIISKDEYVKDEYIKEKENYKEEDEEKDKEITTKCKKQDIIKPKLELLSPSEGKELKIGENHNISWSALNVDRINIFLLDKEGNCIIDDDNMQNLPADKKSYTFMPCSNDFDYFQEFNIKIECTDGKASYVSKDFNTFLPKYDISYENKEEIKKPLLKHLLEVIEEKLLYGDYPGDLHIKTETVKSNGNKMKMVYAIEDSRWDYFYIFLLDKNNEIKGKFTQNRGKNRSSYFFKIGDSGRGGTTGSVSKPEIITISNSEQVIYFRNGYHGSASAHSYYSIYSPLKDELYEIGTSIYNGRFRDYNYVDNHPHNHMTPLEFSDNLLEAEPQEYEYLIKKAILEKRTEFIKNLFEEEFAISPYCHTSGHYALKKRKKYHVYKIVPDYFHGEVEIFLYKQDEKLGTIPTEQISETVETWKTASYVPLHHENQETKILPSKYFGNEFSLVLKCEGEKLAKSPPFFFVKGDFYYHD